MTSPTVTLYSSTDTNAPVLNGNAGSLITVLTACLVNGYGSKAGAGWTLLGVNSGGTSALYKMGSGSGYTMQINDGITSSSQNAAYYAGIVGGAPSSTFASGPALPFPSYGGTIFKSMQTVQATAVPWWVIATSNMMYLIVSPGLCIGNAYSAGAQQLCSIYSFGDLYGLKQGDNNGCLLIADNGFLQETALGPSVIGIGKIGFNSVDNLGTHWLGNSANGASGPIVAGKVMDQSLFSCPADTNGQGNVSGWSYNGRIQSTQVNGMSGPGLNVSWGYNGGTGVNVVNVPNSYDQGYYMSPFRVLSQLEGIRGYMPGIWAPQQTTPFVTLQEFSAPSGQFAGKTFIAFPILLWGGLSSQNYSTPLGNGYNPNENTDIGQIVIEVSSTWS